MKTTINLTDLSSAITAWQNCKKSGNTEWEEKHEERINKLLEPLPSGSGIDAGMSFDWEKSQPQKLIFSFSFHHMDDNGYYDGWTDHTLIITPEFGGYDMRITGRDKNGIKDYLSDIFSDVFIALTTSDTYKLRREEAENTNN